MKYADSLDIISLYGKEIKGRANGSHARKEFTSEYIDALMSSCKDMASAYYRFRKAQRYSPLMDESAQKAYRDFSRDASVVGENLKGLIGAIYGPEERIDTAYAKAIKKSQEEGEEHYQHRLELNPKILESQELIENGGETARDIAIESFPFKGDSALKKRRNYSAHRGGDALIKRIAGRTYVLSACEEHPGMKALEFMDKEVNKYLGTVGFLLDHIIETESPGLIKTTEEDKIKFKRGYNVKIAKRLGLKGLAGIVAVAGTMAVAGTIIKQEKTKRDAELGNQIESILVNAYGNNLDLLPEMEEPRYKALVEETYNEINAIGKHITENPFPTNHPAYKQAEIFLENKERTLERISRLKARRPDVNALGELLLIKKGRNGLLREEERDINVQDLKSKQVPGCVQAHLN